MTRTLQPLKNLYSAKENAKWYATGYGSDSPGREKTPRTRMHFAELEQNLVEPGECYAPANGANRGSETGGLRDEGQGKTGARMPGPMVGGRVSKCLEKNAS